MTLILPRHLSELPKYIGLTFYADGLPLRKSTNDQFWTILGSCDVERSGPFLIVCYHGYVKPEFVNEFLLEFLEEVKELKYAL